MVARATNGNQGQRVVALLSSKIIKIITHNGTAQNMTQTSISLLTPTKPMVARGNLW